MGIFNLFKKKEEPINYDVDLNTNLNTNFSNESINNTKSNTSSGFQDYSHLEPSINLSQSPAQFSNQNIIQNDTLQKDIQILSLKLDAIKAELDNINQRIKNIEAIAEKEQMQQNKRWY